MGHKGLNVLIAVTLIVSHMLLLVGNVYAEAPSVRLIANPNKTDIYVGSEPAALTAKASGTGLKFKWELQGPGRIEGTGSAVFYYVPDKIEGESAQALITVTVSDDAGQETTETFTFNILAKDMSTPAASPETEKKGMSRTTMIAAGAGAGLALVVGIAALSGGGDDGDSGGPLSVAGVWKFAGQLTQDACDIASGSGFTANMSFYQSGSTVSTRQIDLTIGGTHMYFTYAGTVTGNNISMAAVDPYVLQGGGTVIHFGSGIEVQNIKDNSGPGSYNITGSCIQGCSGGCQTIWSGTWTKQ
jgi:hypothetical protein